MLSLSLANLRCRPNSLARSRWVLEHLAREARANAKLHGSVLYNQPGAANKHWRQKVKVVLCGIQAPETHVHVRARQALEVCKTDAAASNCEDTLPSGMSYNPSSRILETIYSAHASSSQTANPCPVDTPSRESKFKSTLNPESN